MTDKNVTPPPQDEPIFADVFDLLNTAIDDVAGEEAQAIYELAKANILPSLADLPKPPESGLSINFYYFDPEQVKHQFTMRAATAAEFGSLLVAMKSIKMVLQKAGWQPDKVIRQYPNQSTPQAAQAAPQETKQATGTQSTATAAKTQQQGNGQAPQPTPQPTPGYNEEPQPGQYGKYVCNKIVIEPKPNNKATLKFYSEGLQHPVLQHTAGNDALARLFTSLGDWHPDGLWIADNFIRAKELAGVFEMHYQYSPKGKRNQHNNLYKDLVSINPSGG